MLISNLHANIWRPSAGLALGKDMIGQPSVMLDDIVMSLLSCLITFLGPSQPCARGLGIRRGLHKHVLPLPTLIRPVDRHRRETFAEGVRSGDALGLAVEDCVGEVLEEQAVVGLGHLKANAPEDEVIDCLGRSIRTLQCYNSLTTAQNDSKFSSRFLSKWQLTA